MSICTGVTSVLFVVDCSGGEKCVYIPSQKSKLCSLSCCLFAEKRVCVFIHQKGISILSIVDCLGVVNLVFPFIEKSVMFLLLTA